MKTVEMECVIVHILDIKIEGYGDLQEDISENTGIDLWQSHDHIVVPTRYIKALLRAIAEEAGIEIEVKEAKP